MGFKDWVKYDLMWGIEDKIFDAKIKAKDVAYVLKDASEEAKQGIVQTGKEFVDLMGDGVDQLTGNDKINEANLIYYNQLKKYELSINRYNNIAKIVEESINSNILRINNFKVKIFDELLPRFVNIANQIDDVSIKSKFDMNRRISIKELKSQHLPCRNVVVNQLSKRNITFSVFISPTYAILKMRKNAKESLEKAYEFEKEVNLEIEKIFYESSRIENVDSSLKNIGTYFEGMNEITLRLIKRFEEKFENLDKKNISLYRKDGSKKLDLDSLPVEIINYYDACLNCCIVLKEMAMKSYIKYNTIMIAEVKELNNKSDEFNRMYMEMGA